MYSEKRNLKYMFDVIVIPVVQFVNGFFYLHGNCIAGALPVPFFTMADQFVQQDR